MGDFKAGLFECLSDKDMCFNSFICVWCQFGKNMETLNDDTWILKNDCLLNGIVYLILCYLWWIPGGIWRFLARRNIRKKQSIENEGAMVKDLLASIFCPCCTAAQEAKEIGAPPFLPLFNNTGESS